MSVYVSSSQESPVIKGSLLVAVVSRLKKVSLIQENYCQKASLDARADCIEILLPSYVLTFMH